MPPATTEFDSPEVRGAAKARLTVPAALTFYAGTMAAFNTTTNAPVKATDAANVKAIGRVEITAAEGEALIVSAGCHRYKNSESNPVTEADFGDDCFIEDDTTVSKDTTNDAVAGKVMGVEEEGGQSFVWVDHSKNF